MAYLHIPSQIARRNRPPRHPFTLNKDSPQAQGLIGWWPLIDRTLRDYSGFQNHGTRFVAGSSLFPIVSKSGVRALDVEQGSSGDEIGCGDEPLFERQAFSVFCWVEIETAPAGSVVSVPVATMDSALGEGWELGFYTSDVRLAYYDTALRGWYTVSTATFSDGDVAHLGWTWAQPTFTAYRDGADLGTATTTSGTISYGTTQLQLGGINGRINSQHDGRMWDVRMYGHVVPDSVARAAYDPATRWDLYYELGRRAYFIPAAAGGATVQSSLDGALQAQRTLLASLDAAVSTTRSKGVSVDAALAATQSALLQVDAALQGEATGQVDLDAALRAAKTAQAQLDAALRATFTLSAGLDASLQSAGTNETTTSLDAALSKMMTAAASLDAAIRGAATRTTSIDAALQQARTLSAAVDGALAATMTLAGSIDGVLAAAMTTALGVDAAFLGAVAATASLDARLIATSTLTPSSLRTHQVPGRGASKVVAGGRTYIIPTPGRRH